MASGGSAAAVSQVRSRLLALVASIVQAEADCSFATHSCGGTSSTVAALPADGCTATLCDNTNNNNNNNNNNNSSSSLASGSWVHATRAPLLVASLRVLAGLRGEEYRQTVLPLFPMLCRLACSSHLLTRLALHEVISGAQFVELLPSSSSSLSSQGEGSGVLLPRQEVVVGTDVQRLVLPGAAAAGGEGGRGGVLSVAGDGALDDDAAAGMVDLLL